MALMKSYRGSIASVSSIYAATIDGLSGGPPLAHWSLGEAAGTQMVDRRPGARHGIYAGTMAFGAAGLPQNSDGAVNFGGTGSSTIPHDPALALSALTLSLWIKPNSLPEENGFAHPYFAKNSAGSNNGDFIIYASRNGDGAVQARFIFNGTELDVISEAGALEVGRASHVCVRADNTGWDMFVDGKFCGKNTNFTEAWSANTADINLITTNDFSGVADCVLDEIALYDRVLTTAEVLALAQRRRLPVAFDDTASVAESATSIIDLVGNDIWVGAKQDLILTILAQPSGGDSVVVNANKDVAYTAGAVPADTARSFTYRITDANGTSGTATVNVTVRNADTPIVSNANCYTESSNNTAVVFSMSALASAIAAAPPGRNILIAPGTYTGGTFTFNPAGTAANPIVVRPQNGIGTVTINNANWTLATGSSRLVISKIFFNNPQIRINGSHHRITRCRFRQVDRRVFLLNGATDTRLDHLDVSDYVDSTNSKELAVIDHTSVANGSFRRLLMDYIYFHDITHPTAPATSSGLLRTVGTDGPANTNPGIVIDHCLMRNNNVKGWGEFIVVKHSGFKIRFCTFENQNGYLEQRRGGGWEVRSCWFENVTGTGPLICFDEYNAGTNSGAGRQLVIGNRLVGGLDLWVGCGDQDCDSADGGTDATPSGHHRSREGRFIGNIVGGTIRVGEQFGNDIDTHRALNNNLWNNTGTEVLLFQQGTTHNPDNEAFTAAVKLTAADVGLAGPDPLCPGGPQS